MKSTTHLSSIATSAPLTTRFEETLGVEKQFIRPTRSTAERVFNDHDGRRGEDAAASNASMPSTCNHLDAAAWP